MFTADGHVHFQPGFWSVASIPHWTVCCRNRLEVAFRYWFPDSVLVISWLWSILRVQSCMCCLSTCSVWWLPLWVASLACEATWVHRFPDHFSAVGVNSVVLSTNVICWVKCPCVHMLHAVFFFFFCHMVLRKQFCIRYSCYCLPAITLVTRHCGTKQWQPLGGVWSTCACTLQLLVATCLIPSRFTGASTQSPGSDPAVLELVYFYDSGWLEVMSWRRFRLYLGTHK